MRKKVMNIVCVTLGFAILGVLMWYKSSEIKTFDKVYEDGINQIDLNSVRLEDRGVTIDFSEIIIGKQEEMRKLIVSSLEATVSMEISDRLIEKLDFDFLKKTQRVSYTGTGYFVVNLDEISKNDIVEDKDNKVITIKVENAQLQVIEIDPYNIIIDEVKEGLLARGDIKLTVSDYNMIEKELRNRLEAQFNTVKNGQEANEMALKMVKEVYEPIVKAIDPGYSVRIEFK